MSELTEEIIEIISDLHEISLRDLRDRLNVTHATLACELFFLTELGFVKMDKTREFVRLSDRAKKYFE